MFSFLKEFDVSNEVVGFRYMNFNNEKVYVEGFKSLLSLDSEKIILKLKDNELSISGEDLKIQELGSNSIYIVGKIKGVMTD